jgi:hypothetical protein
MKDLYHEISKKESHNSRMSPNLGYLAWKLAGEPGVSLAGIGRQLGVSTSAISQVLGRKKAP